MRFKGWATALLAGVLSLAAGSAMAQNVMTPDTLLYCDEWRTSPNGRHTLYFQSDGNLVLYRDGGAIWATNTWAPGGRAAMQGDGNLVIYDENWSPVWASGTGGYWGAYLEVMDDGNVAILSAWSEVVWATNTSEPVPAGPTIYPPSSIYWATWPQQHSPGLNECLGNCGAGCSDTNNPCGGPDQHWTYQTLTEPEYHGTFGPELQCWGDRLVSWEWQQYAAVGRWTYHGWASYACFAHDVVCGGWNLWTGCVVWFGCNGDFWEDEWSYDEYSVGFVTISIDDFGPHDWCRAQGV